MRGILPPIVIILLFTLSLALILGVCLGIGWVLNRLLAFSLFEGTLLGLIAGLANGVIWYRILRSPPPLLIEEDGTEEIEIPESRFWKTASERTWENWFRYVLANSIYQEMVDFPHWAGRMDEAQQQELSIRLAEAALGALKARALHARRLRVNREALRQQMVRAGERPYEDELLDLAMDAVNAEMPGLAGSLRRVARERQWNQQVGE